MPVLLSGKSVEREGNEMNYVQIQKMLQDIKADYIVKGRPWKDDEDVIIDILMHVYLKHADIDHEEIKWLFVNYLETGELNFPAAIKMARQRKYA